jgi:hypothetical protein
MEFDPHEPARMTVRAPGARLQLAAALLASLLGHPALAQPQDLVQASTLLDLSGVAWLEAETFVVVHDGKNDAAEVDRPRVSLLFLPADVATPPELARKAADGIYFLDLAVDWGVEPPNDLESIARIPGTRRLLLAESGDDCGAFQRIFLASLDSSERLTVDEVVSWPPGGGADCAGVFNVEGSAVFGLGGQLFFVYAERAEGLRETELRWAPLQLDPLRFGQFSSVKYRARIAGPGVRPIVALDVDAEGRVYAASAFDSGQDDGPFRSFVSTIGQFRPAPRGGARFVPSGRFADVARQDGYKIEGVTVRPRADAPPEIFAGTDDENYGATLRRVAPVP